eukprot:3841993-Amphidinium_carterae.1
MQVEKLRVTVQDVTQLELLHAQGQHQVPELFEVVCDITGEAIPEKPTLKWNEEGMTKLHSPGAF